MSARAKAAVRWSYGRCKMCGLQLTRPHNDRPTACPTCGSRPFDWITPAPEEPARPLTETQRAVLLVLQSQGGTNGPCVPASHLARLLKKRSQSVGSTLRDLARKGLVRRFVALDGTKSEPLWRATSAGLSAAKQSPAPATPEVQR